MPCTVKECGRCGATGAACDVFVAVSVTQSSLDVLRGSMPSSIWDDRDRFAISAARDVVPTTAARAFSAPTSSEPSSSFCFNAFSSREPVSTSLENTMEPNSAYARPACSGFDVFTEPFDRGLGATFAMRNTERVQRDLDHAKGSQHHR